MAQILDHRGMPVNTAKLTTELAAPSVGSVRQPFYQSAVLGLTPVKLGAMLREADHGDADALLTLSEEIEEKDLHYSSVLRTRKLAVTRLKVSIEAASDDPKDIALADECTALTKRSEFRELMADQMDALGRSFAVNEIDWDKTNPRRWMPKRYIRRDQRSFQFDRLTGMDLRMRDESNPADGVVLEPFKFIVHTPKLKTGLVIRGGLGRLAAVSFMCKSFTLKDWIVFAEVFGMPIRVGKHNASATDEQKAALLRAVSDIGSDAAAIIPDTMIIEFATAVTANGDKLFQGLADWLDRQVSKGVLGQTSTSDAQPGGLGSGTADQANEVREDIRDDDAMKLAATLQRDLLEPFIALNFGTPKNGYPRIVIGEEQREDLNQLTQALTPWVDRGLRVEESAILDKFKLQAAAPDAVTLRPSVTGVGIGQQTSALLEILKAVALGDLPRASGIAAIVASFAIPELEAEKLMGDIGKGFKIEKPEAPHAETPQPPTTRAPRAQDNTPDLNSVRRAAALELMQRVLHGETLTADQRALVEIFATQPGDEIDALADEALGNWRRVTDPMTDQIMAMVEKAKSFDDMLAMLRDAQLDTAELQRTIARLTFTSRGRGDATDKP